MVDIERAAQALVVAQAPGIDWLWLTELLQRSLANSPQIPDLRGLIASQVAMHPSAVTLSRLWEDKRVISKARETLEGCQSQGVVVLDWGSSDYPASLRQIFRPPMVLFVRSNIAESEIQWNPHSLAIVGSRKADSSGLRISHNLAKGSARAGISVVSGLALGIDAAAHRGALDSGGDAPTQAVLGHGLGFLYPRQNLLLAEQILAQGGALITEYPLNHPPMPHQFIARNRIIAGLSRAVVVVQATAKSGSLATARFALEQGKDILIPPGAIDDPRYEGSNRLLKDGATLITSADDVLELFPEALRAATSGPGVTSDVPEVANIISFIRGEGAVTFEQILEYWRGAGHAESLDGVLLELELSGRLERRPGHVFALV